MSSRKARGTRREHAAIQALEKMGAIVVRSGASLSPIDIIALGPGNTVRLIQVKSRLDGIRPSEREIAIDAMEDLPKGPGLITRELWEYEKPKGSYRWQLTVTEA